MQCVVLAAGEGTRLRPFTADTPKALVEVGDRPLIEYGFDELVDLAVDELLVVVGYRGEQIMHRYGVSYRDVPITYLHQRERLGLAHALRLAEPYVDDDFLLMLADNVFEANLGDMVEHHLTLEADATVFVEQVPLEEASRYGVCRLNEDGAVVELVEKPDSPPSNLVLTGFYAFSQAVFPACRLVEPSDRGEYELTDAIDLMIQAGRGVQSVRMDGWRVDVGHPQDRERAERHLESTSIEQSIDR